MKNGSIKHILLTALLAGVALQANAHRTWLLPSATVLEGKEPKVTIDGAVSENLFDFDTNTLKLDGAQVLGPDGKALALPPVLVGHLRSSIDLKLDKPGTYKVQLVNRNVMGSWKVNGETKRFRGTEEAFAKEVPAQAQDLRVTRQHTRLETFVTANKPSDAVLKPTGEGLELVPVTHPNELRAGETAVWRLQLDGKPLKNFPFSLIPGGVRYRSTLGEIRLTTDANGEARVKLPDAGMYWLNASYPLRDPNAGPMDGPAQARRYVYGATLEILPD